MTAGLIVPETTDPELEDEDPIFAHIIGPRYEDEGKVAGGTRAIEAYVEGTPVTAICGYTWVPSRDPGKHPVCDRCKAIVSRTGDQ